MQKHELTNRLIVIRDQRKSSGGYKMSQGDRDTLADAANWITTPPKEESGEKKYTVIDREGTVIDRRLSLAEAANEILSYDSGEWRIDGEAVEFTDLWKCTEEMWIDASVCHELDGSIKLAVFGGEWGQKAILSTNGGTVWGQWDPERNLFTADSGEVGSVGGWRLVTRKQCANQPWSATVIFSSKSKFSDAAEDIFDKVIKADWSGEPEAMLDSDYDNYLEACRE